MDIDQFSTVNTNAGQCIWSPWTTSGNMNVLVRVDSHATGEHLLLDNLIAWCISHQAIVVTIDSNHRNNLLSSRDACRVIDVMPGVGEDLQPFRMANTEDEALWSSKLIHALAPDADIAADDKAAGLHDAIIRCWRALGRESTMTDVVGRPVYLPIELREGLIQPLSSFVLQKSRFDRREDMRRTLLALLHSIHCLFFSAARGRKKLIVIDIPDFSMLSGGDERAAWFLLDWFRWMRSLNASVVTVDRKSEACVPNRLEMMVADNSAHHIFLQDDRINLIRSPVGSGSLELRRP